ncbi:Hypothetical predicted protein [Mytilus galloprovincialis]|uniref:CCHC-type domain-containing protein n=1 Tax=Mytilus galloprovincialis TaxID=29158 RepID=A0A8B6F7W9_MYTGA|nr:Hypothetical predicted protein [Mytilus galloprovincialis]
MDPQLEAICKRMNADRMKRLLSVLQNEESESDGDEVNEHNQNKEKMASFSEVVTGKTQNKQTENNQSETPQRNNTGNFVKPIFLKDEDVHGSVKPPRTLWLTNVEIYNAIGTKVPAECIKGIQRIREMWRLYMDNEEDRLSLLVTGLNLRGRQVPLYSQNPRNPGRLQENTIRIKVKNVPLSADDGQIHRALTLQGCDIQDLFREYLRVNGELTACQTGDRVVISKVLDKTIPRNLQIGKYMARVFHAGQPEFNRSINYENNVKTCHKCLKPGHLIYECPNDWVCRTCKESGHKMIDCPTDLQSEHKNDENSEVDVNESADVNLQSNEAQTKEQMSETTDKTFNTSKLKPSQNSSGSSKHSDTRTGSTKNVQISNVSNSGNDKSQQSIDKFVRTPKNARRTAARNHTPPTPTDNIAPKKSKG